MTTVIVEDFDQGNVNNFPANFKAVFQETNVNIVESKEILNRNEENISRSYVSNVPDVVHRFSGRSVWMEPENGIHSQTENTEKNNPDSSSSSQHKPNTHDRIGIDLSPPCVNSDDISPFDLPDVLKRETCCQNVYANDLSENIISPANFLGLLKRENSSQDTNNEHPNNDNTSEAHTESLQKNAENVDLLEQITSPTDSLKRKVGLFVSKTELEERVTSLTSKLSSAENIDGSSNVTEDDKIKAEECEDKTTPVSNKFKRALRIVSILTIILSFFSTGVSVVKATVLDPEKAVSLILSTVLNTLTSVMIIIPAVVGLAFGKIQARLQKDNPPTLLKCCIPLHFGFSGACVVFGVMSFVASVSGLSVCSVGTCSEDQIQILRLEIVHVISALLTIAANVSGIVFFCKSRTSLMRILPSGKVAQKLNDLKAKTMKLNIAGNLRKEGKCPNDIENNQN